MHMCVYVYVSVGMYTRTCVGPGSIYIMCELYIYMYSSIYTFTYIYTSTPQCTSEGIIVSILDGIWGLLKGSWGVLVHVYIYIYVSNPGISACGSRKSGGSTFRVASTEGRLGTYGSMQ